MADNRETEDFLAKYYGGGAGRKLDPDEQDFLSRYYSGKPAPAPAPKNESSWTDFLKAPAAGALEGAGAIAQGGGDIVARGVNAVAGTELRSVNPLQGAIDWLRDSMSESGKQAMKNSTPDGNLAEPESLTLGKDPTLKGIALNGLNAIGQFAPNLAIGITTAGASLPAQFGIGAVAGYLQAHGSASEEERDRFNRMSHDELMQNSSMYRRLIEEAHVPPVQAKAMTADAAALGGGIGSGIPSGLEKGFEDVVLGALTKGKLKIKPILGKGRAGQAVTGAASASAVGGLEEATEKATQNIGSNIAVGGNRAVGEGTFGDFVMGAIAEGVPGGVWGAAQKPAPDKRILDAGNIDDAVAAAQRALDEENARVSHLALPHYTGPTMVVMPDGTTMTGAEWEQERLRRMVQPGETGPTPVAYDPAVQGQQRTDLERDFQTPPAPAQAPQIVVPGQPEGAATAPAIEQPTLTAPDSTEALVEAQRKQATGELLSSYERALLDNPPQATAPQIAMPGTPAQPATSPIILPGQSSPTPATQPLAVVEQAPRRRDPKTMTGPELEMASKLTRSAERKAELDAEIQRRTEAPNETQGSAQESVGVAAAPAQSQPEAQAQVPDRAEAAQPAQEVTAQPDGWRMTQREYIAWAANNAMENGKPATSETVAARTPIWIAQHRSVVQRAIERGESVPNAVRAEYEAQDEIVQPKTISSTAPEVSATPAPEFRDYLAQNDGRGFKKGEPRRFRTEKTAVEFARQQNLRGYRPRQDGKAWVLSREVTEAQRANGRRLQANRNRVATTDGLSTMLRKWGGIRASEITSDGGDIADMRDALKGAYRNGNAGLTLDEVAGRMAEVGFDVLDEDGNIDATKARDLIQQVLDGEEAYTPEGHEAQAAKAAEEAANRPTEEELDAEGLNSSEGSPDPANVAVVVRAAEINPEEVERLAILHANDDAGFMRAVKEIVDVQNADAKTLGLRQEGDGKEGEGSAQASPAAETPVVSKEEALAEVRAATEAVRNADGASMPEAMKRYDDAHEMAKRAGATAVEIGVAREGERRPIGPERLGDAIERSRQSKETPADAGVSASEPEFNLKGETEADIRARERQREADAKAERDRENAPPPEDFGLTGSDTEQDQARAKGQQEITDFGEKIGGARKDVWASMKDDMERAKGVDIAAEPLSKSWPVPNYQALLDAGADAWAVAYMHAARDAIPAKPRMSWKAKEWTKLVQSLRDIAFKLANGEMNVERTRSLVEQIAKTNRAAHDIQGRADLYQAVGHEKSLEGVGISSGSYSVYKGENFNPPKTIWTVDKETPATAYSNWPRILAEGKTRQEAIDNFKAAYASLEITKPASKEVTFDIFSKRGENGFWIGKKVGRNPILLEGPFPSLKEARTYKTENQGKLVVKLERVKEIPNERRDTNEPRVGEDMREGKDVTPEIFAQTFGFRGVEFGNWVEQGRRQKDLNDAFDALMDMAAILGIPPRAISLNGELGLAFGARGTGGIGAAKAHYEPGRIVINLTKVNGAGSIGHEWWHALDNYFSRARGQTDKMTTEALDVSLADRRAPFIVNPPAMRKEMVDAFGTVMRAIRTTAMMARAAKLDGKRTKEYWTTKPEMSARAFESYLISKLQDQGASNDYLANIVDEETWKAAEALGFELDGSYPYPTAGEVPKIRAAFDTFFQTVQTKETDKGTALFSRSQSGTRAGITKSQLRSEIAKAFGERVADKLISSGIIQTVETQADLPAHVQAKMRAGDTVFGFYDPRTDKTYYVMENLTPSMVKGLTVHEVGTHYGLEKMLGEKLYDGVMRQIEAMLKAGNKDVAEAREVAEREASSKAWVPEETLAYLTQNRPEMRIVKRIISAIKAFLYRNFGILEKHLTVDDLAALVSASVKHAANKTQPMVSTREQPAWHRADTEVPKRKAQTISDAREAAEAFVGKALFNKAVPWGAVVSKNSLSKMTSESAVEKSTSVEDHALAVANIDQLYPIARLISSKPDARGARTIAGIHRFAVEMVGANGALRTVKLLVKETTGPKEPNPIYTVEVEDVERPGKVGPADGGIERVIVGNEPGHTPQAGRKESVAPNEDDGALARRGDNAAMSRRSDPLADILRRFDDQDGSTKLPWMTERDVLDEVLALEDLPESLQEAADTYQAAIEEDFNDYAGRSETEEPAEAFLDALRAEVDAPAFSRSRTPSWATSDALKSAASKIDTYAPEKTIVEKVKEMSKGWQERTVQAVFDAYAPLKRLGYKEYVMARMAKATDGALEGTLLYGKPVLGDDGVIRGDLDKKGFLGAMKELKGEHDRFLMWVAGNRSQRLMRENKEHLFTKPEIEAMVGLDDGKMADGSSRRQAYAKALASLNSYNRAILDIAEKTGLIDGEGRKAWEHDFYVPFFRVDEDMKIEGPVGKVKGLVRQQAFQKLKGGTEPLGDLLSNTMRNWSHLLSASMANQAAAASLKKAEQIGVAQRVPAGTKGATYAMIDGEKVHFEVEDAAILDAISAMEASSFKGLPMQWMGKFKHYLTLGTTVSPSFRVRNLIRDSLSAIGQNDMSYNVMSNLAKGYAGTDKKGETYQQMLFNGALMRFGQLTDGKHAEHVKRLIAEGVDPETILTNPAKVKAAVSKLWDGYQEFGDRMENVNRAALYQKLKADGLSELEAAFASRDMMDFSLQGSHAAVRFLTQIVPFMNARLQGLYKLGRAAKEDPARMGYVIGGVALASIALMLAYQDDDDWKKREDWDRDNFWWFKAGGVAFRIPKPFEIGAMGTLAERSLELMISDEMTGKRFRQRIGAMLGDTLSLNPTPQLVKPAIDLYANKDSFTGRQIETRGMENLSKPERFGPNTSGVAKVLGKAGDVTGLSPVQIDHLGRAYFGWLGAHAAMTADVLAQPFMDTTQPTRKIGDYFVVGDFVKDLPSDRSRYVEQFYKQAKEIHETMGDLKKAREAQDVERVKEILADKKEEIALSHLYQSIERRISEVNKQITMVRASKATPDEKRERLDRLTTIKNELARVAETRATELRASAQR